MITITVIGSGNVAWHLIKQFAQNPLMHLKQHAGRREQQDDSFKAFGVPYTTINDLEPTDLTIIAVNDTAIAEVSHAIPYTGQLVVHTSGSMTMDILSPKNNRGVFYPLQTFSKSVPLEFKKIPICIEAIASTDVNMLKKVAFALSENAHEINTISRKKLHLAAVFANNFTNHCYTIAQQLCQEEDLPFELLHELITETAKKAITHYPDQTQTGPAKRGDQQVLETQEKTLSNAAHKIVYSTLSKAITTFYGKKL